MRLDISQHMRMLQQMKLAPRMIQSMEILQLPIMALEERIRQEAAQNPALELGTSSTETPTTDLEAELGENHQPQSSPADSAATPDGPTAQEVDAYEQMAEEWSENYIPAHHPSRLAGIELSDKKHDALQNVVDRPPSLEDHLLDQLTLCESEPLVLDLAKHLIANLDERGFLNAPLSDIAATFGRDVTEDQVQQALALVQQLQPTGVGARDLRECLLLQLEDPNPDLEHVDVLRAIITNHWDDLIHNRLPVVERKSGYSLELIQQAIQQMRHLELNPARGFSSGRAQYVVPDIVVERDSTGEYVIRINDQQTPHIHISRHYLSMLRDKRGDPKALEYIKKKIDAAQWLIDSIRQRRNTLEKVTREIIRRQRDFLEKGPDAVKPLKMQEIADVVDVHVTTVSRAVDDKWVQTPRGLFPLRRFFGGGTVTSTGEEVAWDTIKHKLTEVVQSEDKRNPYSDDELVEKLQQLGYPLARRTVTKYRKMLGIPASRQRKQHV
jgi:RNA polymerase sigma-54 factor